MHSAIAAEASSFGARAAAAVPDAFIADSAPQLIVTGSHGMGHAAALSSIGARLEATGRLVTHIDCRHPRALDHLAAEPAGHAVLLHQGEFASVELLALIASRSLAAEGPIVVGWDDSDFGADANGRIDLLRQRDYELAEAFERLQRFALHPWDDRSIDQLVHSRHSAHPDALTVLAIRTLAKGRPVWAIELTGLASDGFLVYQPRPSISRLDPVRWNTSTMREVRHCIGELSESEAAAALALGSIEQISRVSASQVFGSSTIDTLVARNMLIVVDEIRTLLSPVLMLIETVRQHTAAAAITRAEDALASHFLAVAELGASLSELELRFCAASVASSAASGSQYTELLQVPAETRTLILRRAASLAADFGRHDTARSLQVAAMRLSGPGDPIELVRAIAVRDDPFTALTRLGHEDVYAADEHTVTYLRGLLRTEAGIAGTPAATDHSFLLDVWNSQDQLDGSLVRVQEIARNADTDIRLRLLADALMLLASATSGLLPDPRVQTRARASLDELAHPGAIGSALTRDAQSTYLLTLAISELLSTGRVRLDSYRDVLARMPWPESHAAWLRLLESASLALAVGDAARAEVDWALMLEFIPRFAAARIAVAFRAMRPSSAERGIESQDPPLNSGYVALLAAHWSGDFNAAAQLMPPAPQDAARNSPLLRAIREVVNGHLEENPIRLMRAADSLKLLGQWASALAALEHAQRILIRRRSSGAITLCNAQITKVVAAAERSVPWPVKLAMTGRDQEPPRLTAREIQIAELAATSLTNKEIAAALTLSVRTVESHLAQARAKLGASSRSELNQALALLSRS